MTYKVGIIGAGKIGLTIFHMILGENDTKVSLADQQSLEEFEKREMLYTGAKRAGGHYNQVDVTVDAELEKFVKNQDAIVSSAPYFLNKAIAESCLKNSVAYFDLTEDVDTTAFVKKLSKGANVPFMPQCGLAPGAINIIANHLAKNFDHIRDLELRVGALALYPSNHMKYYISWSTAGVINEYCNPCEAIWNSKKTMLQPLEGYEKVTLDGVEYEGFNTSGGVATLCDTYLGKVDNLTYKTLRYPGHRDYMKFLMDDLNLGKRKDLLVQIFDDEVPYTTQDVVVVYVNVVGENENGFLMQKNYVNKIYGQQINGIDFSAIQIATASGVVPLIMKYKHDKAERGFIGQESVDFDWFTGTDWGETYKT